ncbi:hypothetical protein [Collinsella aerofaciens]|nr:hypothetical protein [Collinsella aerofaciens]
MPVRVYTNQSVEVELGKGDIRIFSGVEENTPAIFFTRSDEAFPVGTVKYYPPDWAPSFYDVKLTFKDPKSIDIVINALKQAKLNFSNNEE